MKQTTQLLSALAMWNCEILYQVNFDAPGNCSQVKELRDGNVVITLDQRGSNFFITQNIDKAYYSQVWKVKYTPEVVVELTDADFEAWLKTR